MICAKNALLKDGSLRVTGSMRESWQRCWPFHTPAGKGDCNDESVHADPICTFSLMIWWYFSVVFLKLKHELR